MLPKKLSVSKVESTFREGCSRVSQSTSFHVTYKPSRILGSHSSPVNHSRQEMKGSFSKSRVEEMLKRVKDQPVNIIDPWDLAAQRGIMTLSHNDLQPYKKVFSGSTSTGVTHLESPFIKVDITDGKYQPLMKEFHEGFPSLKVDGSKCPFFTPNAQSDVPSHCSHCTSEALCSTKLLFNAKEEWNREKKSMLQNDKSENYDRFDEHGLKLRDNVHKVRERSSTTKRKKFVDLIKKTTRSSDSEIEEELKRNEQLNVQEEINTLPSVHDLTHSEHNVSTNNGLSTWSCNYPHCLPYACRAHSPSVCGITIKYTEEVKCSVDLPMPIRPLRSGKLCVFLPVHKDLRQTGEIHVVFDDEREPVVPKNTHLFEKTVFHFFSSYELPDNFPDGSVVVSGGNIIVFTSASERNMDSPQCTVNVSSQEKSSSGNTKHVETIVQTLDSKNTVILNVKSLLCVHPDQLDELPCNGNDNITQVLAENDINSGAVLLNVNVFSEVWKPYSKEFENVWVPQLNVGVFEIVIAFLQWAHRERKMQEWVECGNFGKYLIPDEVTSHCSEKSCCNFQVVFTERSGLDTILQNALEKTVKYSRLGMKEVKECFPEFEVKYPVQVFKRHNKLRTLKQKCKVINGNPKVEVFKNSEVISFNTQDSQCIIRSTEEETESSQLKDSSVSALCLERPVTPQVKCRKLDTGAVVQSREKCTSCSRRKINQPPNENLSRDNPTNRYITGRVKCFCQRSQSAQVKPVSHCIVKPVSNDSGYCEICDSSYTSLAEHELEESHRNFFIDNKNFQNLDNCFSQINSSSFLKEIMDN